MRAAVRPRLMMMVNLLLSYKKLLENARMWFLSPLSFVFIRESISSYALTLLYFRRRFLALLATHLRLNFRLPRLPLGKENHLSSASLKLHHYTNCLIKNLS